jgi:diguanylate cyclase (GGDEF)-like protein
MLTDISEIRHTREKLAFLATHDSLTKLPNRSMLFERLEHSIASMKHRRKQGALIFIDIDHFKDINDNYGHRTGDCLLQEIALRLQHFIRKNDTVGRLSGDEFLLIIEDIESVDAILLVVHKIKKLFERSFHIKNIEIDLTVSMGIALFPDDGESAGFLIHAADQAMYSIKKKGRNDYEFYSKEFSLLSSEYFKIQTAIKRAIKEDGFDILYQPQFSLVDGSLTGIEALLRCDEDEVKDIPIIQLITIAEESGLISAISHFVLKKSCKQISEWQEMVTAPLRVAVNLSRRELCEPGLVETIRQNIELCCLKPLMLEFEITESTLIQSSKTARKNIEQLRQMGCRFSIDDFGTGYSSLSNLKEFNFDKLKIDKSFVDNITTDNDDKIIVSATISMAKKLGLTVLAEGVENDSQAKILKGFGCDEVQGYLYSRPVAANVISDLLQRENNLSV